MKEASDKDRGVRPVELLAAEVVAGWGNAEPPAFPVVQQRGKDARRVEVWQTEPVEGAVHPDQRGRAHVADDAIVLNGLVRHCCCAPSVRPTQRGPRLLAFLRP